MPEFLPKTEASELFQFLKNNAAWKQDVFHMAKGDVLVPRLTAFYAQKGVQYKYAGLTQEATGMLEELAVVTKKVNNHFDSDFNSILLNYYRDERDSIGLHSDSEKELGSNPVVGTLSLGGTRRFDLISNKDKKKVSLEVEHGSLMIMGPNCQKNWRHKIDKYTGTEPRISITLRKIYEQRIYKSLQPRTATMRKKETDRYKLQEPDKKALEQSEFIEQTEMFGSKWNRFKDPRGWTWVQEEL